CEISAAMEVEINAGDYLMQSRSFHGDPLQHLVERQLADVCRTLGDDSLCFAHALPVALAAENTVVDVPDPRHAGAKRKHKRAGLKVTRLEFDGPLYHAQFRLFPRQHMDLLPPLQLQAVLDLAQQLVGSRQFMKIAAAQVTLVVKFLQRE